MPKKVLRIFVGVFGGIGLVFLGVAVYFVADASRFGADAVRTQGTVISDSGQPLVAFIAEGREIRISGSVSTTPPRFHAGDKVTILYSPDDPEAARIDSFSERWLGALIFGVLGVIFSGVGGGFAYFAWHGRARRERALRFGRPVQARITDVALNTLVHVNGRSPWVNTAHYNDRGRDLTFKSQYLWENPGPFYPSGSDVTVCFLDDDPRVYAFKLEKLPWVY